MRGSGKQAKLAKKIGTSAANLGHVIHCRRNVSLPRAEALGLLTGSPVRIWLNKGGGSPEARRAAVENWEPELSRNYPRSPAGGGLSPPISNRPPGHKILIGLLRPWL